MIKEISVYYWGLALILLLGGRLKIRTLEFQNIRLLLLLKPPQVLVKGFFHPSGRADSLLPNADCRAVKKCMDLL